MEGTPDYYGCGWRCMSGENGGDGEGNREGDRGMMAGYWDREGPGLIGDGWGHDEMDGFSGGKGSAQKW